MAPPLSRAPVDWLVPQARDAAGCIELDTVIVGSGYGGSVAALRLSERGHRVVVLERGSEYLPGEFPNTAGQLVTVQAASGNGRNWLQLNNGAGQGHQTLGIQRSVGTLEGAVYTLSLDYAGALGLAEAYTRIGIYVDDQLVGSYANTSGLTELNWQALSFQFTVAAGPPQAVTRNMPGFNATKIVDSLLGQND